MKVVSLEDVQKIHDVAEKLRKKRKAITWNQLDELAKRLEERAFEVEDQKGDKA